jgi:hypothetical protein
MSASLSSGTCSACGGREIYSTRGINKLGERMQLPITSFKSVFLDTFVCLGCGRFEERIPDVSAVADKIRASWTRV